MTKPVAIKELNARIKAVLRRHGEKPRPEETRLIIGEVIVYPERYEVTVKGKPIKLTHKEYELLLYLVTNKPNVLNRDQILQEVWGYDYLGDTNVVDVYISYLRKKIDRALNEQYIFTIQGVGYAIRH